MKILSTLNTLALLVGIAAGIPANCQDLHTLVVTASNILFHIKAKSALTTLPTHTKNETCF